MQKEIQRWEANARRNADDARAVGDRAINGQAGHEHAVQERPDLAYASVLRLLAGRA